MKFLTLLPLLSYVLSNSPVQSDSPEGSSLIANFDSSIKGHVEFESTSNGSVLVHVEVSGLPATGGPFPYHIHEAPVPSNGNCTGTKAHFNPFNGSATATTPAAKELGDLAGRHGNITGQSFSTEYIDQYLSLNPDSEAYFGGLSVVIHSSNNSRLACANITENNTSATVSIANGVGRNEISVLGLFAAAAALLI